MSSRENEGNPFADKNGKMGGGWDFNARAADYVFFFFPNRAAMNVL